MSRRSVAASPAHSNGSWPNTRGAGPWVINVALGRYLGIARALPFVIDYTSVSRITASRTGRRAVISVNETAHVRLLLHVESVSGR